MEILQEIVRDQLSETETRITDAVSKTVKNLVGNTKSDPLEIKDAIAGNICRCATYPRIRRAVHEAAAKAGS